MSGRQLQVVRWTWVLLVTFTCILWIVAGPARYSDISQTIANLSPAQELVLRDLGIPGALQAGLVFAIEYAAVIAFLSVSIFIFWRRSDDWVAIFISGTLIGYIAWTSPPLDALLSGGPFWGILSEAIQVIGFVLAGAIFLYFPDGRLYPRWASPLLLLLVVSAVAALALPPSVFDLTNPFKTGFASFLLLIVVRLTGFGAQVYRYFTFSTPIQRQQSKWILSSVSLAIVGYIAFGVDRFALPLFSEARRAAVIYDFVGVPFFLLCILPIPVAFAYAILRHRLWDIDALISRTIVYASLTAILAGFYVASITLTQRVFVAVTGERSAAAIALTTLAVAASATPIRTWLQGIVDRYVKQAPDASRTLLAFGGEVDSILEVVDSNSFLSKSLERMIEAFGAIGGALFLGDNNGNQPYRTFGTWGGTVVVEASADCGIAGKARFALGPRKEGQGYSDADISLLADTVRSVADTVIIVETAGFSSPQYEFTLAPAMSSRSN
jgi:hypothetical protein